MLTVSQVSGAWQKWRGYVLKFDDTFSIKTRYIADGVIFHLDQALLDNYHVKYTTEAITHKLYMVNYMKQFAYR